MKNIILIIVFVHGLIHLMGFVKAFNIKDMAVLTLPISKPLGIVWLIAALLFLIYGLLYTLDLKYSWIVGLIAVVISQVLVIYFWKDAKFGTLPNFILMVTVLFTYGHTVFTDLVEKEQIDILQKSRSDKSDIFSESEITHLPTPVKKWLVQSGVIGQEKAINGKITQKALMKMKPDQEDWYSASAIQYTVVDEPSFIWKVDLKMNTFMWLTGRDKFQNGKGEMVIKMNSIFKVVDESGEKIDEGSLQRYLGEMVWFPSLAISPYVNWEEIDEFTAKATMNFKGTKGSGTFYFNDSGDFVKFIAKRFQGSEGAERKEWILTVDDYRVFEGVKIPSKMKATWKLEEVDWTWLELEISNITYNISVPHD